MSELYQIQILIILHYLLICTLCEALSNLSIHFAKMDFVHVWKDCHNITKNVVDALVHHIQKYTQGPISQTDLS